MSEHTLAEMLFSIDNDPLGELLRSIIFPGEGFGCYSTFEVQLYGKLSEWDESKREKFWIAQGRNETWDFEFNQAIECAQLGQGFTHYIAPLFIHTCWYWDGDGTLAFKIELSGSMRPTKTIINTDCKKDYGWEEV